MNNNNLNTYIPEGSTILNSEIIEKYNSQFVRVIYELNFEYMKKNNLSHKKRFVDILLVPSKDYEGASVTSAAYIK